MLLTTLSALAGASWVAHRAEIPPPVEQVKDTPKARDRDLVDYLKQTVVKGTAVEVSEAELNRHLAKVITTRAQPGLAGQVLFERLALDLEPGVARATLMWKVHGVSTTARVDFSVSRLEKTFQIEIVGGAYGHLEVPRGLLRPLAPALGSLAEALRDEIQAVFQMNQVHLAKDKLLLDPRFK